MKSFKFSILLLAVLTLTFTACVKDKGFENNEYGITDPNATEKGLGFPLGNNSSNVIGLDAVSSSLQVVNDAAVIGIYDGDFPKSDVKINFVIDNSIVDKYNSQIASPSDSIRIFKPIYYSIPSSTITVPAGTKFGQVPIRVPSTVPLSLDSSYAIGLRIVSNDGGYVMPTRTKQVLLIFNLKNKYDGVYTVNGTFLDTTNATFTGRYPLEYQLVTTGPNSCDVKMLINGEITPGYLFSAAGAGSFFGNWGLSIFFDPITNKVTEVRNYYGDPGKPTTGVGTPSAGTGAPLYAATNTRRAVLDPAGINLYDASVAKPTVKIKYRMLQSNVAFANAVGFRCKFDETWVYKGPRP